MKKLIALSVLPFALVACGGGSSEESNEIPEPSTNESELTKEEEEKIESQLKKLGYIEETDSISNNTQ